MEKTGAPLAEYLSNLLSHGDSDVRREVALALRASVDVEHDCAMDVEVIIQRLVCGMLSSSETLLVQEQIATTLSHFGIAGALALYSLSTDVDAVVRAMAVRWVGHIKCTWKQCDVSITEMLQCLASDDDNADVRFYAAASLARLGDENGLVLLQRICGDSDLDARRVRAALKLLVT